MSVQGSDVKSAKVKAGAAAPAPTTPWWFRLLQVYSIATIFIEVALEFPKLKHIIDFDAIYTLFPPLAKGPVTHSPRWWILIHFFTSTLLSFATPQLIFRSAAVRRSSKPNLSFIILAVVAVLIIVPNSNHLGLASAKLAVPLLCSMCAITLFSLWRGLNRDWALALFYVMFTNVTWLTLLTHHKYGWPAVFAATSAPWAFIGAGCLVVANLVPWFNFAGRKSSD